MSGYGALVVLAAVIVLGPVVAVRIRLPAPVVLIIAGIALGPGGLGWLPLTPEVTLFSTFGFLVLMFVAGMEIDFASLRSAGPRLLIGPFLTVAGFFAIAVAIGVWRSLGTLDILVISATSVGMPLAVLQETGALSTPLGRHVLLTASIGEFVSIVAFTGFEVWTRPGSAVDQAIDIAKVILLFVLSAVSIRVARAVVWWHPEPFGRLVRHHDVAELGVRTGVFLMFGFVALAAFFGVEAILGAFIGGALVSFVLHEKHALEAKIAALGQGMFIPIFFVVVGVKFDARILSGHLVVEALVLAAAVVAVKVAPAILFAPREMNARSRVAAGALLSAPLTLVVAIAAVGRELGVVTEEREATLVVLALLLSVVFPVLFRVLR